MQHAACDYSLLKSLVDVTQACLSGDCNMDGRISVVWPSVTTISNGLLAVIYPHCQLNDTGICLYMLVTTTYVDVKDNFELLQDIK